MSVSGEPTANRTEARDFYAVLDSDPSASLVELRAAFRRAVLQHHPDRSDGDALATRRTSVLNRAWSELRDPLRRLHYDNALEHGRAEMLAWPLGTDRPSAPRPRVARAEAPRSRWHMPEWRNVGGFRVPVETFLAGPAAQDAWIVAQHIDGEDWRAHRERYWLRYAIRHYRERGRVDDWLGAQERLIEIDGTFETLAGAELRVAYQAAGDYLRGIGFLRAAAERYAMGSAARRWVDRELRTLLGAYRDHRVRRGAAADRAEAAELLLNFLEALEMEPGFADVRAAIMAHLQAGNRERADELLDRAVAAPVNDPARWFSLAQLLTESGRLEQASRLLAEIARGDHPEALDRRLIRGDPVRRIAAARTRLQRALVRAERSERVAQARAAVRRRATERRTATEKRRATGRGRPRAARG
jgi:curved DNA-binding protein CbpA